MDTKLNMIGQCALAAKKANGILGCIRQIIAKQVEKGVPSPLLSIGEVTAVSSSGLLSTRETRESPAKGHKDIYGTGAPHK